MSADAYRDDVPRTLAEALGNEYNEVTWFPTGPPGSALQPLSGPENGTGKDIDNAQHEV